MCVRTIPLLKLIHYYDYSLIIILKQTGEEEKKKEQFFLSFFSAPLSLTSFYLSLKTTAVINKSGGVVRGVTRGKGWGRVVRVVGGGRWFDIDLKSGLLLLLLPLLLKELWKATQPTHRSRGTIRPPHLQRRRYHHNHWQPQQQQVVGQYAEGGRDKKER